MNSKKFIHLDGQGGSWGIVSTEQLWAQIYALKYNKPEKFLPQEEWQKLFSQALEAAKGFGAQVIECRIRQDYDAQKLRAILTSLGLTKKSERVEYKSILSDLPNDHGSPLHWKSAQELHWTTEKIAQFTSRIIEDALDVSPDENPEDFIQDWLKHDEYTCGPDCIAIGFLKNEPCALVVAQVEKNSGWSRLSYMGVSKSHRGQGLGRWVHRHGFQMMKNQGGKTYHGGTNAQNIPMRKLFESHGCKLVWEMEEWSLNLVGGVR